VFNHDLKLTQLKPISQGFFLKDIFILMVTVTNLAIAKLQMLPKGDISDQLQATGVNWTN